MEDPAGDSDPTKGELSWNTEVTGAQSEITESVPKALTCHRSIEGKGAAKNPIFGCSTKES